MVFIYGRNVNSVGIWWAVICFSFLLNWLWSIATAETIESTRCHFLAEIWLSWKCAYRHMFPHWTTFQHKNSIASVRTNFTWPDTCCKTFLFFHCHLVSVLGSSGSVSGKRISGIHAGSMPTSVHTDQCFQLRSFLNGSEELAVCKCVCHLFTQKSVFN